MGGVSSSLQFGGTTDVLQLITPYFTMLTNDLKNFFHVKQKIEDMRLSLGLTTSMPLKESLLLGRIAEEKGYSRIWVGEDINGLDVFAYLSILAVETRRITIGTGITSVFLRNLAVIANSSAGIQILSEGRFCLGLGVGGVPEVTRALGFQPRKVVPELEESVSFLRKVFKGDEATINTRYSRIKEFSLAVAVEPPRIYLGVRGPEMLALAGRVADGLILSGPREYLEEALNIIDSAAEEEGRNPHKLDKVVWNPFVLTADSRDMELAKDMVEVMLPSMPPMAMKYLKGAEKNELLQKSCICGDEREAKTQIKEYSSMGFSEVVVGPPFGRDPETVITTLGDAYDVRH